MAGTRPVNPKILWSFAAAVELHEAEKAVEADTKRKAGIKILLVLKRRRAPSYGDAVDHFETKAYLATCEQRRAYLAYVDERQRAGLHRAEEADKQHKAAVQALVAGLLKVPPADGAAQPQGSASVDEPAGGTSKAAKSSAPASETGKAQQSGTDAAKGKVSAGGGGEQDQSKESATAPARTQLEPARHDDGQDDAKIAAIFGQPIATLRGSIFFQDAPSMRTASRYHAFDASGEDALAIAIELMGPDNTSRLPDFAHLVHGGLVVIHAIHVVPKFRSKGIAMRITAETLRELEPYWSKAILVPEPQPDERSEPITQEERKALRERLVKAFARIGFRQLATTKYLYAERGGYIELVKKFAAQHKLPVEVAHPLCLCFRGVSLRMRAAIVAACQMEYDRGRDEIARSDAYTRTHDLLDSQAFLPSYMTMVKTHLKGFLFYVGTIGGLCAAGDMLNPSNVDLWLEFNKWRDWRETHGWAQWRAFHKKGGNALHVLDMLLFRVQRGFDTALEGRTFFDPPGERMSDSPSSLSWLLEHLPACAEHDNDFEGLRHWWWSECNLLSLARGPYRGDLAGGGPAPGGQSGQPPGQQEGGGGEEAEVLLDGIPLGLLGVYQREQGQLPEWARDKVEIEA